MADSLLAISRELEFYLLEDNRPRLAWKTATKKLLQVAALIGFANRARLLQPTINTFRPHVVQVIHSI
jgi:hypothetical protein